MRTLWEWFTGKVRTAVKFVWVDCKGRTVTKWVITAAVVVGGMIIVSSLSPAAAAAAPGVAKVVATVATVV